VQLARERGQVGKRGSPGEGACNRHEMISLAFYHPLSNGNRLATHSITGPGTGSDPPYLGDRRSRSRPCVASEEPAAPAQRAHHGAAGCGQDRAAEPQAASRVGGWIVVDREFSRADAEPHAFANAVLTDVNRALRRLSLSTRLKDRADRCCKTRFTWSAR